jgi:hypothetical protein
MKSNLMLKKFVVESVPGTMSQKELRTFFGSKVIYSEDRIHINNDSISFTQVVSDDSNFNGYQYYADDIPEYWETHFYENLSDLKSNNQNISLYSQNTQSLNDNTRWQITLNGSNILRDYLFFKLKEQRTFKVINGKYVYSNNINKAIYEYIDYNIFRRYRLERVDFYVKYYNFREQTIYDDVLLQYKPKFNPDVYVKENVTNKSLIGYDPYKFDNIIIQYNQSKPSNQYSFDYYFDLIFTKI